MVRGRKTVVKAPRKLVIVEEEFPSPGKGEVLIKTKATLISIGTELTKFSGDFPRGSHWDEVFRYPYSPGYSNCGEIIEVGEGVEGLEVGDRVASLGPHAEYVLMREGEVYPVPDGVSDEEATFATLAATVMNGVRLADVKLGESVVVLGLGILGQLACQFSGLCGGFPVIGVDMSEKRLKLAEELGATLVLNPRRQDVRKEIERATKGRGADVVFEVTGNPEVIPWGLRLTKRQGRFIVLSSPRGPSTVDFHDEVNWPSRIIIGTHFTSHPSYETPYNPWTVKRNIELFFDLILAGKVDVKKLITHRYPWTELGEVYRRLLDPLGDRLQYLGIILTYG